MYHQKYADYELTDFLEDDQFIKWAIGQDEAANSFWLEVQQQYPDKATLIAQAADFIRAYNLQDNIADAESRLQTWSRIEQTLQTAHSIIPEKKIFRIAALLKIAAAALVIIIAGVWLFNSGKDSEAPAIVVATSYGEIKNITLPDKSVVTLNANSILRYSSSEIVGKPREVWIKGEAYFNVAHRNKDTNNIEPSDRFIVHCSDIDIEVLGTTFNVKARNGKTDVALLTGKIRIDYKDAQHQQKTMVMAPGDYVAYSENKVLVAKKIDKPEQVNAWTGELISFNDATLKEIAETLTERFGYTVTIKDEAIADLKIEGEISVNSVAELLDVVTTTLDLTIEQSANKNITITR